MATERKREKREKTEARLFQIRCPTRRVCVGSVASDGGSLGRRHRLHATRARARCCVIHAPQVGTCLQNTYAQPMRPRCHIARHHDSSCASLQVLQIFCCWLSCSASCARGGEGASQQGCASASHASTFACCHSIPSDMHCTCRTTVGAGWLFSCTRRVRRGVGVMVASVKGGLSLTPFPSGDS